MAQVKEKTAFATSAQTTFQQMMYKLLRPHGPYAAAYLRYIIVHRTDWTTNLRLVGQFPDGSIIVVEHPKWISQSRVKVKSYQIKNDIPLFQLDLLR